MKYLYLIEPHGKREFVVIEARCIGQHYEHDSEGYGFPRYIFELHPKKIARTFREADAYIEAAQENKDLIIQLPHSTFCGSMGAPGDYALDKKGGPLFTVVK